MKLAFRQEIDLASVGSFEKEVFGDSYREFCMQAQAYNPGGSMRTLEELIAANPKANSLHYKVGFSVGLYIAALKGVIPGIKDLVQGQQPPGFQTHEFRIVHSDLRDRSAHKVAITYYTDVLTLLESFGEQLLMANGDVSQLEAGEWVDSFMLRAGPSVTISQYAPLRRDLVYQRMAN